MRAYRRTTERRARLRDAGGYSLVEMTIAVAVAAIIGLGVYAVFNLTQKSTKSNRIYNDLLTSCNFAMDQMKAELLLAGYRVRNLADATPTGAPDGDDEIDESLAVLVADGDRITFNYFDDNARDEPPYDGPGYEFMTRVTYRLDVNGNLLREMTRVLNGAYDESSITTQRLAANIASMSFDYYSGDNVVWNSGVLRDIRTIRPTLVCNAAQADPNTGRTSQIKLTGEVRARNAGVASSPLDISPPATPTGLIAWDTGECGRLQLRWDANTDIDLEGYTVFYGLSAGTYTGRFALARAPKTAGQYEYYTVTGLDSAVTGITPEPQYYFAINAYDKSGNASAGLSNVAAGNPVPSARSAAAASGGSDTTIHPIVPAAPATFSAAPGSGSLTLTWTQSPVAGLTGYRLYRSQAAADFTPDDTPGTGNLIANETVLNQDAVSFTDTGLIGCSTYYYKLTAIACDAGLSVVQRQFAATSGVPADTTRPSAPTIAARPGFRRIILTLTNPVRTGPGAEPDFSYTRIYWSKNDYPVLNADGTVTPNQPIPRSKGPTMPNTPSPPSGTFSDPGSLTGTINFNDETSAAASAPNLAADTTYFFRAVAYDLCGNSSDATSSSLAEGTQCGDCLLPAPAAPGTPDPACYGAPPAPSNVDAEGCYGYVDLRWDPIDDVTVRDFQGFRLLRREGSSWFGGNASTEVELTGDDAAWLTTYRDASVEPGKAYSYRVMATDCYYEQHNGKPAADWPESGNNPADNFADTFAGDIAVGQIERDWAFDQVVTGYLQPDPPTLPLAVDPSEGMSLVPTTFRHNSVTVWTRNSAASILTLRQFSTEWENQQAFLQKFAFGDGSITPTTIGWEDTTLPLEQAGTGSVVSLGPDSRLLANDDRIPMVTIFRNADGSVDAETDQREQTLEYTLDYRNDSTGTEGCSVSGSFHVPLGPYVYGVTQSQPSAGTRSWPVPGDQGGNAMNVVAVPGGTQVAVFANVYDSSNAGLDEVILYYYVDYAKTLTAPPPVSPTAQYPTFPPYTAIALEPVAGTQWRTPPGEGIPATDDSSVWFFILAVDKEGNFDRDPEVTSGAYQYYQAPADPCLSVPGAPLLVGSATGGNVTLTWVVPTINMDGTTYFDQRGYRIYRDRDAAGWTLLTTIDDKNALTYTDTTAPGLDASTYRYYMTAIDTCLPTPNESPASAIYTESVENPCNNTPKAPVLSGTTDTAGGSVTLAWTASTENTSGTPVTDLVGYWVWRRKGTAAPTWLNSTSSGTLIYKDSGLADLGTADYQYWVEAVDTCTPSAKRSAPSNIYIDQSTTTDPCTTTPGNVPSLTATEVDSTVGVVLVWAAPATQSAPAGMPYNDAGGYRIWRAKYYPDLSWTGESGVVMTLAADQTTWTDSSVAGTVGSYVYRYWVIAFDTCSTPRESPSWTGPYTETFTDPCNAPPGEPTSLAAMGSGTGVTLSWQAPSPDPGDLDGYDIERRLGAAGAWTPLTGSPFNPWALSRVDNTADAGLREYWYRVRALDSCPPPLGPRYSPWSVAAQESYVDPCLSIPDVPGLPQLAISSVTAAICANKNTDLSVTWTGPTPFSNATSTLFYRIYRCPTSNTTEAPADCTVQVYPASESPLPVQNDLTEMVPTGGLVPNNNRIWIWVEAVSARSTCAGTFWQTLKSAPVMDACEP